jgi:hypothetical protein
MAGDHHADKAPQSRPTRNTGCKTALSQTEFTPFASAKAGAAQRLTPASPVLTPASPVLMPFPKGDEGFVTWQNHGLPPPTDLTLTLQHLLI